MTATGLSRRAVFGSLLGAAAVPAILKGARRPAGDKPNLLFLWTDEQRADTLAVYGNYRFRVPVMNGLASRSIVFDRAYDTQPVCTPARSSVLTGLWPHQTGLITNNLPLPPTAKTFPELVSDPAYRTGYFGKWHLGDELFAQHGFQEWISIEDIYNDYFTAVATATNAATTITSSCGWATSRTRRTVGSRACSPSSGRWSTASRRSWRARPPASSFGTGMRLGCCT